MTSPQNLHPCTGAAHPACLCTSGLGLRSPRDRNRVTLNVNLTLLLLLPSFCSIYLIVSLFVFVNKVWNVSEERRMKEWEVLSKQKIKIRSIQTSPKTTKLRKYLKPGNEISKQINKLVL